MRLRRYGSSKTIIDILSTPVSGFLDQGLMVRDSRKLRENYFSTSKWKSDILSLLPTDLAYLWWPSGSCSADGLPCPVLVRANRLLRVPRMLEFFDRTETKTGYPNVFRICKVVFAILILIHWNSCLYFAISYVIGFGTDRWVYDLQGARNSSLSRQYIYCFYWSTLTLTTIGKSLNTLSSTLTRTPYRTTPFAPFALRFHLTTTDFSSIHKTNPPYFHHELILGLVVNLKSRHAKV